MLVSSQLVEFLVVGLLSTTHCLVMCGALVGGVNLSLPVAVRQQRSSLLRYLLAYNGGRILSYALAGFLAGWVGEVLVRIFALDQPHSTTRLRISELFLVGIGLSIAGWLPGMAFLERGGNRLWQALEPFARSQLPVQTRKQALFLGLAWGWFPCGLTYTILLWTATTGNAVQGALAMTMFGVGTLPGLLLASFFAGRLTVLRRAPWVRRGLGLTLVLLAIFVEWQSLADGVKGKHSLSGGDQQRERAIY